ncbi:MAG TPA: hypothetical protein PKN86_05855 [Candidatus Obscuribacter sp.]|nr:hypothetical protein [Candidatus Obscuribacter sp.]HMW88405.1 hypothetical protein [Candidatus Obscuribacter sp.]HMY03820.1 hypothetical protein [Candidatus Obscuribacter sp.]HMY51537.1 hypothetical protein [Candidatus Obscuribacter sp.]HNA71830.1 hypothetical protein [Candidatus Obscuribacter sp.]
MVRFLSLLALPCLLVIGAASPSIAQGYLPPGQEMASGYQTQGRAQTDPALIKRWFAAYDQVRRQAQMTPSERRQADAMLSKGLSMFVPGDEKLAGQKLLSGLIGKYQQAMGQMKQLPLYPETEKLHRGYYQYFSDARNLFSDYIRVQNEPFAKDPNTGERLIGQIVVRKANLTDLESNVKALDAQLRGGFGIAPYRY